MRNIRRSVALALAAIMMMAMNMVSFAADTAPAETEAVESVTRSTNGESVLLDKVYFACDGKNTISLENLFLLQLQILKIEFQEVWSIFMMVQIHLEDAVHS